MKKLINTAFIYAIAAMCGGVFYREFTKLSGFTGKTTLSVLHTHLFVLGMFFLLIAALFCKSMEPKTSKKFHIFYLTYNIGVPLTAVMLFIRGVLQVQGVALSAGLNAAISGVAGIAHILTGVGIVFFFLFLKEKITE